MWWLHTILRKKQAAHQICELLADPELPLPKRYLKREGFYLVHRVGVQPGHGGQHPSEDVQQLKPQAEYSDTGRVQIFVLTTG